MSSPQGLTYLRHPELGILVVPLGNPSQNQTLQCTILQNQAYINIYIHIHVTLQLIITYMYIYIILYIYILFFATTYYLFNSIVHIIMICIYIHIDTTYNVYVAQTFARTYYPPNFFPQLAGLDHDFCVSRNVDIGQFIRD